MTRTEKLERFFEEVAHLTVNHDELSYRAVVYPSKLGKALERVDPEWFNATGKKNANRKKRTDP